MRFLMLNRPRKIAHPENLTRPSRTLRGNTWFWCDKKITRFFRKNFSRKHYNNLRAIYLALCEIDSDFHEGQLIRGFKKTLCTYSGRSIETVTKYFYFLEELQLVTAQQIKDDKGHFGTTHLYISTVEDQLDEYHIDPEWWDAILDTENLELGKGYNIAKWTINKERLTVFPAYGFSCEPENPVHKNNYNDNEIKNNSNEIKKHCELQDNISDINITLQNDDDNVCEQTQIDTTITSNIDVSILNLYTPSNVPSKLSKKQLCFKQRADKLVQIINTHRKINKNTAVHIWYKEFEKMYTSEGISLKRIDAVLEWYTKYIGTSQWIPVVHSAKSFRCKFTNLEDAIWRQGMNVKNTPARTVQEYNAQMNNTTNNNPLKNNYRIKDDDCIYYHINSTSDDICITFKQAVQLIKEGKGSPHELVDDWFQLIKEQEKL